MHRLGIPRQASICDFDCVFLGIPAQKCIVNMPRKTDPLRE